MLAVCGKENIDAQYALYDRIEDAYVEMFAHLEAVKAYFVREASVSSLLQASATPATILCAPQFFDT